MTDSVLEKYAKQQIQYFQQNQTLLQQLMEEGQKPEVLFITCSDSRIMVEGMLGLKAGDFFVYRNIAACVPPFTNSDWGTTAVLEFAVMALQVKHIIICGHTDCGGILKAESPPDANVMPAIAYWLEFIQPARKIIDDNHTDLSPQKRHQVIVEQHVVNQLANLRSYPYIRNAENQGELILHGWIEDLFKQTLCVYEDESKQFVTHNP